MTLLTCSFLPEIKFLPILAIGIPHCKTCTVVSTADCTSGKWHVAEIVWNTSLNFDDSPKNAMLKNS